MQALALRGALVTLTDLPACLELMRYNVELNFAPSQLEGAQSWCLVLASCEGWELGLCLLHTSSCYMGDV